MITLGDIAVIIRGDRTHLDRTLDSAERKSRSFAAGVSGFLTNAFSYATGGFIQSALGSITTSITKLKQGMIGGNADFEQFNTQFGVLLGNTELAKQRMAELAAFGASTPFDLPGVVQADTILQSFGFHAADVAARFGKSGEQIRTIAGDVASGTTASFQEISTLLGRFSSGATGEAIMRMQELGITTREELAGMGLEFAKSGELLSPLPEAMTAVLQLMEEKYGGLMDAQSKTFGGMLSNLGDWMGQTARIIGQPIFDRLKEALAAFLELVKPGGTGDAAIKEFSQTIRLLLDLAKQLGRALVGDVADDINGFIESLNTGLQKINAFLRQLKDEIAGLNVGDILAELAPGLDDLNQKLAGSLAELAKTYEQTVTKIKGQIEVETDKLGKAMVDIGEKYGPQIADLQQRMADAAADYNERVTDQAETHAKRRADIEKQIAKSISKQEEKLTDLKTEHQKRRQNLVKNLMFAESEEQYLQIQEQLKAEDEKYGEQTAKAKEANQEQVTDLQARLAEEDKEYAKQGARLQVQRGRQVRDFDQAMAEITTARDKDTAAAQKAHDDQVAMLENRLKAEGEAYKTKQADIQAIFAEQAKALEAEINARAAAIGSGPAAQVGGVIRDAMTAFEDLKATVGAFLSEHATPLIGLLLGIGAVLVGGGVLAAVSALGAAIAGISLPVVALIALVAGLYTAWAQNWGGIQEKTQAFIDWAGPYVQAFLADLQKWWADNSGEIMATVNAAWEFITTLFETALTAIQAFWQEHGDWVMAYLPLVWDNIKAIMSGAFTIIKELFLAFTALLKGDWQGFADHLGNAATTLWETIKRVFQNNVEIIKATVRELIETVSGYFTDKDWSKIGFDVIGGIKDGLLKAVQGLTATAKEAGETLLKSFKNFFGISSPSKLFADEVGGNIAKGIGAGIDSGMAGVQAAAKAAMQPLTPGALAGAGAGAGSVYNVSPTFNLGQAPADFDAGALLGQIEQRLYAVLKQFAEG
jgi:phage-related protein